MNRAPSGFYTYPDARIDHKNPLRHKAALGGLIALTVFTIGYSIIDERAEKKEEFKEQVSNYFEKYDITECVPETQLGELCIKSIDSPLVTLEASQTQVTETYGCNFISDARKGCYEQNNLRAAFKPENFNSDAA